MFGRALSHRLRAARKALDADRLEEALRLLAEQGVREHRSAAPLLRDLAERLADRAREHYNAGRYADAIAALDKALWADPARDDLRSLREEIRRAADQSARAAAEREAAIRRARNRLEAGSLDAAHALADRAADDPHARSLQQEALHRLRDAQHELAKCDQLLERGHLAAAADRLKRALRLAAGSPDVLEAEARLLDRATTEVREALAAGRLDHVLAVAAVLADLGGLGPQRHELERTVALLRRAAAALRARDYAGCRLHVAQIARLVPDASWIVETTRLLETIAETDLALRSGPLGLLSESSAAPRSQPPTAPPPLQAAQAARDMPAPEQSPDETRVPPAPLPHRLLLLVDGAGSFLVIRGSRASIGRGSPAPGETEDQPDIPLQADLFRRHAEIVRLDEDYFLAASQPVRINGEPVQQRALLDGDMIELGRHARLRFRLLNPISATAVLDLSARTRMARGVRRVILLDRHALIGPHASHHITCPDAPQALILYEHSGQVCVRPFRTAPADRFNDADAVILRPGQHCVVAQTGICIEPWTEHLP